MADAKATVPNTRKEAAMAKRLLAALLFCTVATSVGGCYFEKIQEAQTAILCQDETMDPTWRAKMCGDSAAVQPAQFPRKK